MRDAVWTTSARKILVLDGWKPLKIVHTFKGVEEMGQWLKEPAALWETWFQFLALKFTVVYNHRV